MVVFHDLVDSIKFEYGCIDCEKDLIFTCADTQFLTGDEKLWEIFEEAPERCWTCQRVYDCGGLENRDFL